MHVGSYGAHHIRRKFADVQRRNRASILGASGRCFTVKPSARGNFAPPPAKKIAKTVARRERGHLLNGSMADGPAITPPGAERRTDNNSRGPSAGGGLSDPGLLLISSRTGGGRGRPVRHPSGAGPDAIHVKQRRRGKNVPSVISSLLCARGRGRRYIRTVTMHARVPSVAMGRSGRRRRVVIRMCRL